MDYNLSVTQAEADLIGAALGELPHKQVAPLFHKLLMQCQAQNEMRQKYEAMQASTAATSGSEPAVGVAEIAPSVAANPAPKKKKAAAPAPAPVAPANTGFVAAMPAPADSGLPQLPTLPVIPNFG